MHTVTALLLLTARFYSIADVPAGDRATATQVASNILRAAGIEVRWMDCNASCISTAGCATRESCLTPPHSDEVIVRLVAAPAAGSG